MNTAESIRMETKEGIDALFLYATEGILVVNAAGEIMRINPSAERLFGYERDELTGKKIEILIPRRLAEKHTHYAKNTDNIHTPVQWAQEWIFMV